MVKNIIDAQRHIEITLDTNEFEITRAEAKATYKQIKEYILEKHGVKVHTQFIAEIKRECGISERINYNKSSKSEEEYNKSKRFCTEKNRQYILEAFEHFRMI